MLSNKEEIRLNQIDGYHLPESYEDEQGKLDKEKREKAPRLEPARPWDRASARKKSKG